MNVKEEEADTRTVSHVNDAVSNGFKKIIFASNDTDVVVYILNCACYFQNIGFGEFWIQYSSSDKNKIHTSTQIVCCTRRDEM